MVGKLYEERPNYTFNELVADIGGSLGLVLGLSMIDICVFGRTMCRVTRRKISQFSTSRKPTCSEWHKINHDANGKSYRVQAKTQMAILPPMAKPSYVNLSNDEILTKL